MNRMKAGRAAKGMWRPAAAFALGTIVGLVSATPAASQTDTTMAQGGLYARPFIGSVSSTSIGGYVEGNSNYFVEDGVTEGFSLELRRFNVFLFSQISQRVRFLSELEFEHGTEEIALETALIDFQVSSGLVLRGGIILPPLGFVNQNHDSPRWDFVERPFVSTDLIPSTLSEVGFGAYGRFASGDLVFSYDAYLTNGLGDEIVGNEVGRTDIASGKSDEAFGEDNNGTPAFSGRIALRHGDVGEVGLSYYGGTYNSFRVEGEEVDDPRRVEILALDFGGGVGLVEVRSEVAFASIDVPPSLAELFGSSQWGGHLDVLAPILRPRVFGYADAVITAGVRLEGIDYNRDTFSSTGEPIGDELWAIVPGVSFRPTPGTVFRANYRYHWIHDMQGNDPARAAGFQVGFASYF